MKSKTKISKQTIKKKNPELVETINLAKKQEKWLKIASILTGSKRKRTSMNLEEIDIHSKDNEKIVIPGKVLSQGDINKKIKIIAFQFSKTSIEKLNKKGIEHNTIIEEIKKNPQAKEIKLLTKENESN